MRAAIITEFGGIDGISIAELETPALCEGKVLIQVEASTIGFADSLTLRGIYPPGLTSAGIIPGGEVVGRVAATSSPDSSELIGRRVFAYTGLGGHAEFVAVPVENLTPVSDAFDPKVVAGFGIASIVARAALERAGVALAKTVLVRGAAGGVGLAAVRQAHLSGCTLVATTSSEDRADYLRELGVSVILDRDGRTSNRDCPPIDIILDPVGGVAVSTFLSMLAMNGVYMLLGVAGGFPDPEIGNAMMANFFKSLTFSTLSLHSVAMDERAAILTSILEDYAAARIEPDIDMVVSLDEIQSAHRRIEANQNRGKIVLAF